MSHIRSLQPLLLISAFLLLRRRVNVVIVIGSKYTLSFDLFLILRFQKMLAIADPNYLFQLHPLSDHFSTNSSFWINMYKTGVAGLVQRFCFSQGLFRGYHNEQQILIDLRHIFDNELCIE